MEHSEGKNSEAVGIMKKPVIVREEAEADLVTHPRRRLPGEGREPGGQAGA